MSVHRQHAQLRHRVTIQTYTETQDTFGEPDKTWSTYATRWARIEPVTGREYYSVKAINATISHKMTIRNTSGLTPKMRIVYGSRTFQIVSVANIGERDRFMELMCYENV